MKAKRISLLVAVLLAALFTIACTQDPNDVQRILRAEGVSQVALTGYDPWSCSDSDSFSTGFTGVKNGVRVAGVVCGGFMKANTVRYK